MGHPLVAYSLGNMGRLSYGWLSGILEGGNRLTDKPEVQHIDYETFNRATAKNLVCLMKPDVPLLVQQLGRALPSL